jgi:hypothetical protein
MTAFAVRSGDHAYIRFIFEIIGSISYHFLVNEPVPTARMLLLVSAVFTALVATIISAQMFWSKPKWQPVGKVLSFELPAVQSFFDASTAVRCHWRQFGIGTSIGNITR